MCPTPWDHVDCSQLVSLSIEFSNLGYWNGLPFPSLGHFLDPGIEPRSSALLADSLPPEPPGKSKESSAFFFFFFLRKNCSLFPVPLKYFQTWIEPRSSALQAASLLSEPLGRFQDGGELILSCCCCSVTKLCPTLPPHGLQHTRLPCPSLSSGVYRYSLFSTLKKTPKLLPYFCWTFYLMRFLFLMDDSGFSVTSSCIHA